MLHSISCPSGYTVGIDNGSVRCIDGAGIPQAFPVPTMQVVGLYPQTVTEPSEAFADGMTIGWAVAAVMVAVYVIRRPFR